MKNKLMFISFVLLIATIQLNAQIVISGKITDTKTGEDLIGATVMVKGTGIGTVTNSYGFYSLEISHKQDLNVIINFSYLGYKTISKKIVENKTIRMDVSLEPTSNGLKEVTITASKSDYKEELNRVEFNVNKIKMKQVETLPVLAGEIDLVKIIQLMPGVTGGVEGTTGMYVRGGKDDQNLILLDEAPIYNLSHLGGFLSVFNPDVIKDVKLVKGAFGANYGGRLSSILDVKMKDGNNKYYQVHGGVGIISSRLTIEGPIIKDKASFIISGRRSYIDKILGLFKFKFPYYFYDFNAKLNYKINKNNRIFYSRYQGYDKLKFDTDNDDFAINFGFVIGNTTNTLRWNHIHSSKLFSNLTLITTKFNYDLNSRVKLDSFILNSNYDVYVGSLINDIGMKYDFDYYRKSGNTYKFGAELTHHNFRPNAITLNANDSTIYSKNDTIKLNSIDFGLYALNDWKINRKFRLNYGIRLAGSIVENKTYFSLEPRFAARYLIREKDVLKFSYSRMNQFIHRVSSSNLTLPIDVWRPISNNIKPQISNQVSFGYQHLFEKQKISFSAESYYKLLNNIIAYKEGTNLILNNDFISNLVNGKGRAWGFEFLIKKDEGRLNGWLGYTLSWADRKFEKLNHGKRFPAKYDRRHNLSIVLNYRMTKRWFTSAVWVFISGLRATAKVGKYISPRPSFTGFDIKPIYTSRNAVKLSDSHRLDISITRRGNAHKRFYGEFSIGAYNVYNRVQPAFVSIRFEPPANYKYIQPGLLGTLVYIKYDFHFSTKSK